MKSKLVLRSVILVLYTSLLFFLADTFSLALFEVENFTDRDNSILYYPLQVLTKVFSQNDLVLRAFMITLHLLSMYFFFQISKVYLDKERDRLWNMILFVLLPSVVSSAIIVHPSGLTLLLLLFFIHTFQRIKEKALWMLPAFLFIDISFFILFFGLMFYYLFKRKWAIAIVQLVLMVASVLLFGFLSEGFPSNYFFEMFGVASLIFSPLLFIYYLYTLLRIGLKGDRDIVWVISLSAFVLMLLFSMRQRVTIEHFAPYLIILLPLMVKQFMHAYRIRIRRLRRSYKILFVIALLFLVLNSLSIYFNRYLYFFLENPKNHFLYEHYVIKELASSLKKLHYTKLDIVNPSLAKRLAFYGINNENSQYSLRKESCKNVTISYDEVKIASFCVTKKNSHEN